MSAPDVGELPVIATPVSQLKRKRAGTGSASAAPHVEKHVPPAVGADIPPPQSQARHARRIESEGGEVEESDSDDQASLFEDMLELIEEGDYVAELDGNLDMSPEDMARLRIDLKKNGPQVFLQENLKYGSNEGMYDPRLLGAVFGIDPDFPMDDHVHLRLLGLAVRHAYSKRCKLPQYNNIDDAARLLRTCRKIIVITGAGISTSLGIPDFRSKQTGFYEKLREAGYSDPEEVFDINEFDLDPSKFYGLAGDLLPELDIYSPTHAFIRLLQDQGRLRTNYTQNIDNLEELAGIEKDRLIQCHGSFATASCRKCKHKVIGTDIFADMRAKRVARCKQCLVDFDSRPPPPKRRPVKQMRSREDWEDSESDDAEYDIPEAGVMKPDITFFGERLPDTFFDRFTERDQQHADLVLVIGTSLKVAPVSEIPNYLPAHVPHIFISREPISHVNFDIQLLGDCDKVVFELCRRAGWQLKHEMLPKSLNLTVQPADESGFIWRVSPSAVPAPNGSSTGCLAVASTRQSPASSAPKVHLPSPSRIHQPGRGPA